MKKILLLMSVVVVTAICTCASVSYAVEGTVTQTSNWIPGQNVKIVKVSWVSTAAGEVWQSLGEISGKIFGVRTVPAGGALAPDDNYDLYIKDFDSSYSYLTTTLENRDTANTELVTPSNVPLYGSVGFSISGAGNLNAGDAYLYIEVPR